MAAERTWWSRYVRDVLRREPDPPVRRAPPADWALAVVLTVLAVFALTYAGPEAGPRRVESPLLEGLRLQPTPPADRAGPVEPPRPPRPPEPSQPPEPRFPEDEQPPELRAAPSPVPPETTPERERIPADDFPYPMLTALTTLPLAVRRRYPLGTFWVVLAAALAAGAVTTWITMAACAIAAYSAVAHGRHRVVAVAGLVVAAVPAGAVFAGVAPGLPSWLGPFLVLVSAGALAGTVRFWRHRLAAGRERIAALHRAQEEATREAVREERARIAAELHDVVTHNVSVMVIQAGAARAVLGKEPEGARQALLAVESGGRAALAELRHVMGLLSASGDERPRGEDLEPQPGLDRLDALIGRVRAAGVRVSAEVSLPSEPLAPGVELTAYRVVQEALTNTIKHAAGASASVTIGPTEDRLEIEVTDTGGTSRTTPGGGRGLIGLRERLGVYGGTLDAGPAGGGYRLVATIPWRDG